VEYGVLDFAPCPELPPAMHARSIAPTVQIRRGHRPSSEGRILAIAVLGALGLATTLAVFFS
jgi:hypothetical protein